MIPRLSAWLALMVAAGSLTLVTIATTPAHASTSTSAPAHARADRDCSDFPNQAAAQAFYIANGGPASDPHRLDAEGDGIACETLPCPCSTSTGGGGGGGHQPPAAPAKTRVVKVLSGELVRVRKGKQRPYVVHLMGVKVPRDACRSRAAKRDLRSWVEPGMVVRVIDGRKSRKRDKQGHLYRYLVRVKGGYDVGGSQIDTGFGQVDRKLRFQLKKRYLRWEARARAEGRGYHGTC
ncbi:excalibur calcium-binding domain-containing protein [Pimelobacter simplex]|uniref:excalibur calcium-binding domain-containing protein n=1 Tax=Nocardioides simplex TaxID=2045 RepID=UPI0038293924